MVGGTPGTDYTVCPHCPAVFRQGGSRQEARELDSHIREEHPDQR